MGDTEQCILGHIGINLSGDIGKLNQSGSTKFDQTYLIDNWKREDDSSDFTSTFRTFFPHVSEVLGAARCKKPENGPDYTLLLHLFLETVSSGF